MARTQKQRLGGAVDRRTTREAASRAINAPRKLDDADQLAGLLQFAEGVLAWVNQFEPLSPATAVTANAISHRGVDNALDFIDKTLRRHAQYVDVGPPRRHETHSPQQEVAERQNPQRQLTKTLNYFDFLRASMNGSQQYVPDHEYPYEALPVNVQWHEGWEPADNETEQLANAWFRPGSQRGALGERVEAVQRVHDRIGTVARETVIDFTADMVNADRRVGFRAVRSAVEEKHNARAKAACLRLEKLTALVHELVVTASESGSPLPFGNPHQEFITSALVVRFVDAGQAYAEHCLSLLPLTRSARQMERKAFLRRIGVVSQYAHLASGNGRYPHLVEVLEGLGVFARALREDVVALLPRSETPQPDEAGMQEIVHQLNRLIIEPDMFKRWRKVLGKASRRIGGIIDAIIVDSPLQDPPWTPGDMVTVLNRRGLLKRGGQKRDTKSEEIREALFSMQQLGLAIQAPWDYIAGRKPDVPTRKGKKGVAFEHKGLPWLVNPLGAVLAYDSPARAATNARSSKKRGSTGQSQGRGKKTNGVAVTRAKGRSPKGKTPGGSLAIMAKRRPGNGGRG
jgi:hypothetical protein